MAGIYIHIPFCRRKCTYCDFYKIIAPELMDEFVDVLIQEIELKKNYLGDATISSIYFGGGTPSLLNEVNLQRILDKIFLIFSVDADCEITLEANPDDLSEKYTNFLKSTPINRLSVGIQSFNDKELKLINRRHSGQQARDAIFNARKSSIKNISIDLIYGIPGQTIHDWEYQLGQVVSLDVEHISVYGLTYEEGTALWTQRKKGIITETDDEVMIEMYDHMLLKFKEKGFEAYEISNFAKPGFRSRHNSAYWNFTPYLGLGPSAHSFNGVSRQWNISSVLEYFQMIKNADPFEAIEILTKQDFYNEYVMVRLRTTAGIDLSYLKDKFGEELLGYCLKTSQKYLNDKYLQLSNNCLSLTVKGIRISNLIIADMMKAD